VGPIVAPEYPDALAESSNVRFAVTRTEATRGCFTMSDAFMPRQFSQQMNDPGMPCGILLHLLHRQASEPCHFHRFSLLFAQSRHLFLEPMNGRASFRRDGTGHSGASTDSTFEPIFNSRVVVKHSDGKGL
jgi:hypothetical protein